jgi:hypothetical protein
MTSQDLIPCYANTLFLRGEDYAAQDGPLVRVQMLTQLQDCIADLNQPELIPYVGALALHTLEQFSASRNHWDEPAAILHRVVPSLSVDQNTMSHEILRAWRECCPRGYVLLPKQIHAIAVQLQTETWNRETEEFAGTPFTERHLTIAAH